ncbi:hypothetical protein A0J48_012035 [Sphaerospermopsis aphanizomenoides BCCUSP55]|uniref:ApeA N-terminal domain 1-containing protein n=1 Tax=Sphaerospermopsis aphanizomenoides TaxID=459663 RepID=UPI00190796D5|nr:HEPN domain-containing protein [Sphaerospermopsis aphanizomenoides]MBK1988258.1 hypothetical protein [Sphaerospermopsis aphanizomenoides BCCUSP55]
MRIKEKFQRSGYFWLPSAPDRQIPGTLSISDGGSIELEVVGLFDESIEALNGNDDLKRIVGHIEKDGLVTLDNCFYKQKNITFGGISKSLLYVNRILIGVKYDKDESIVINTFCFSVEGIDEWVGISGIKVDHQFEAFTATISYAPPEEISLNLNNGMHLLITFSWTLPGLPITTEARISQKTYFKLVSTTERELNDFISIAHKITTFLCFAIDKIVCMDSVIATSNNICETFDNDKTNAVPIKIYYPSLPYSQDEPKIYWHGMLFRYQQIQNDTEGIINKWIDAYDQFDNAFNLYFSVKTGSQKYLDGKFLALVQGLETYHRRKFDEKLMDEAKFKELVENIVSQCPEEHQEWLAARLQHGNEVNLRKRIKSIIEPFKDVIGTSQQRSKIISSIVDTRNYLTHYNESLKPKIASGIDLFSLCLKLEAFFQLHFLQVLGFTQKEIKSILDNCYELKRKLNQM